jgi:hypothetical protein
MWLMCQFNAGFARNHEFGPTKQITLRNLNPKSRGFNTTPNQGSIFGFGWVFQVSRIILQ